jgi:branched-chain amino acid transport system permease protein
VTTTVADAERGRLPFVEFGVCAVFLAVAVIAGELLAAISGKGIVPGAWLADGVVQGLGASLFAAGLLLVYKSSRIIGFAHGSIALGASIVAFTLVGERWSWWVVTPLVIVGAAAAGVLIEAALLRRFANSPRLVPTVATIAAGQVLVVAVYSLPKWRFGVDLLAPLDPPMLARLPTRQFHAPFAESLVWRAGTVRFTGDHLVATIGALAALAALAAFLRYSRSGTAIRAAAENPERAALLGIGTGSLGTIVWAIAGALAGLSTVLGEPLHNGNLITATITGGGSSLLLRGLAAAVVGRMTNLPRTITAAVALTVFERCVFWSTGRTAVNDVVVLLVIGGALLVQRKRLSRTEEDASAGWAAAEEIRPVPAILRALPSVQTGRRWVAGILAVAVIGYPFAMSPSQVYIGTTYAIYGIVAVSLVVLAGWGGQISLGQFGLVAVGAAVGGSLTANAHVPFPIAALLASVAGGAVAILLGLPALRIRGLYLAVTTLAFAVAMSSFVLDRRRFGFLVPPKVSRPRIGFVNFADERAYYYLTIAGLAVAVIVATRLRRTRTGRVLIAMRDNERAAQSMGISLMRTRLATFAISGAIAAFAGVLLVHQTNALRPEGFTPERSIQMFLMTVIGGLGSVSGVLTGALYLGSTELFVSSLANRLFLSSFGVLMVLVFFPRGLGGVVYSARDAWLRRTAIREKIFVRSLLGDVRDLGSERSRAPLAPAPDPEPVYEVESDVRVAGGSQRSKGWVYQ